VLSIGGLDVTALGDFGSANAELQEAYQNTQSLTVRRDGQRITLPQAGTPEAPLKINTPGNQPASASNAPAPSHAQPPQQSTPTAGGGEGLPDQLHHITIPGGL